MRNDRKTTSRTLKAAWSSPGAALAERLEGRLLLSVSSYQQVGFQVGPIAADPVRNLVYVVDVNDARVLAIDTDLGRTVASQRIAGGATGLAVAAEDDRLFIASSSSSTIQVLSLPNLTPMPTLNVSFTSGRIAAGAGRRLYMVGSTGSGAFTEIDENSGQTLWQFGSAPTYGPLLKTNADGTRLYAMELGLSGVGTYVYQYDINTSGRPTLTAQYPVPEENGEDFAVDEANNRVFSMNGGVYSVHVTDMITGAQSDWQDGGIYGAAVAVYPTGDRVFGGSYSNIREFNRADGAVVADYPVPGGFLRANGMVMTANGRVVYVANDNYVGVIGSASTVIDNVPVARFTAQQSSPGVFTFDAGGSEAMKSGQTLTGYAWDFGDGAVGAGLRPGHTFAAPGTYNVKLTVTASSGLSDDFILPVHVTDSLEAHAGGPYTADVGALIMLDGSGSIGNITSYQWDLNYDGSTFHATASGPTVSLSPASAPGVRTVALRVSDGSQTRIDVTTVTTLAINSPPTFTGGSDVTVDEDAGPQSVAGWATQISAGPPDEAGQTLQFDIVSDSNLTLFSTPPALDAATGTLTFTSAPNANGSATIGVQLRDNGGIANGGSDVSPIVNFHINVTPVNDAPVANSATFLASNDTPTAIRLTASDVDGDPLTFSVATPPAHGTLSGTAPDLTYIPDAGFLGNDTFTFAASDGRLTSAPATITIRVNGRPTAFSQVVSTPEDTPLPITLQATDPNGDALTFQIVTPPAHGTLTQQAGVVTYLPAANYNGPDQFTFAASDGLLLSAAAQVLITITPVDDAPIANPDNFGAPSTAASDSGNVLANDQDIDGTGFIVSSFTQPAHGAVRYLGGGIFRYLANSGYGGTDQFTYTIRDPRGLTSTAPVSVSVGDANLTGSWTTLGNGPGHTGYFPGHLLGSTIVPGWTAQYPSVNPVAVADGKVFVTGGNRFGAMFAAALDPATGSELWNQPFAPGFSINPPTYDSGHIYLQRGNHAADTALWSLNTSDGSIAWKAPHEAQWESYKAPVVADGKVFVDGGYYGGIYGFNQATGAQLFFNSQLAQDSDWTPAYFNGEVYEATGSRLAEHDPLTGAINWSVNLPRTDYTYSAPTPVVTGGWAYVETGSDLYAVNLSTHAVGWHVSFNTPQLIEPAVAGGLVYVGVSPAAGAAADAGEVRAYDATTGTLVKTYSHVAPGPIIVTDDAVISSPSVGGPTSIFDKASGTLVATIPAGGALSLADNVLYVVSAGTIQTFRFRPATAEPWATALAPVSVPEGGSVPLSAGDSSGTKFEWDFNYDGAQFTTDATGPAVTFSAAGLDGPATRTIALRVSTDAGSDLVTTTLTVVNVPPAAQLSGSTIPAGGTATVTFTAQTDPSPADLAAGFRYSYDFNGDGVWDITDSTSPTASVPSTGWAPGAHPVTGRIKDKDGGYTDYTTTVQVLPTTSIAGTVFYDANRNGLHDPAEPGLFGITVYNDANNNGKLDPGELAVRTDASGAYLFTGLAAGNYKIRQVRPVGYTQTAPTNNFGWTLSLVAGQSLAGKDFGAYGALASIGGAVFDDLNADGNRGASEPGISGVIVYIDANGNSAYDPGEPAVTTNATGDYRFTNLVPGSYVLRQVLPPGWARTAPLSAPASLNLAGGDAANGPTFGDVQISTVPMDFNYLLTLAQHYGQQGTFATGDLNDDGQVNFNDLLILAQNYGHALPSAAGANDSIAELARKSVRMARRRGG